MKLGYLAIDQYGTHYSTKKHPRKELLEQLGATHAAKMYTDTIGGQVKHIGYIVNGLWLTVYEVHEWSKESD